jgi:hypothetical protein
MCQEEFLSKEYPTDGFFSETFARKIFYWQLRKVLLMELLPTTTNLLTYHRVSHMHGFARKLYIICFNQ